jgi:hypothetical protein
MSSLDLADVRKFVNDNIGTFHSSRLKSLEKLKLKDILKRKNPYLFKAKNITTASELISSFLEAYLSSSEEKIFGDFLEELAIFIAGRTYNGQKSSTTGIDLDFKKDSVRYLVSIKSGPNWGNSSQYGKLKIDFERAIKVLKQHDPSANIQPVLGICYGKSRTSFIKGYTKVMGQSFWHLISDDKSLYIDIIKPLGHRARQQNQDFIRQKSKVVNLFTVEFITDFCDNGEINWERLVRFNSGNMKS